MAVSETFRIPDASARVRIPGRVLAELDQQPPGVARAFLAAIERIARQAVPAPEPYRLVPHAWDEWEVKP